MAAYGVPEEQIARTVGRRGISPKTLRKHFRQELAAGMAMANAKLAQTLFQTPTDNNLVVFLGAQLANHSAPQSELVRSRTLPPNSMAARISII